MSIKVPRLRDSESAVYVTESGKPAGYVRVVMGNPDQEIEPFEVNHTMLTDDNWQPKHLTPEDLTAIDEAGRQLELEPLGATVTWEQSPILEAYAYSRDLLRRRGHTPDHGQSWGTGSWRCIDHPDDPGNPDLGAPSCTDASQLIRIVSSMGELTATMSTRDLIELGNAIGGIVERLKVWHRERVTRIGQPNADQGDRSQKNAKHWKQIANAEADGIWEKHSTLKKLTVADLVREILERDHGITKKLDTVRKAIGSVPYRQCAEPGCCNLMERKIDGRTRERCTYHNPRREPHQSAALRRIM